MVRHFEVFSRHRGGIVLRAQQFAQLIHAAAHQLRENDRAERQSRRVKIRAAVEKPVQRGAVGVEARAHVPPDPLQLPERDHAEQFGGVRRDAAEQVVHPPHRCGQPRLGDNPSAAQAAQSVHLRQARRDDKVIAQVRSRARGALERRVEINLVHHHPGARAARNFSDCAFSNYQIASHDMLPIEPAASLRVLVIHLLD